MLVIIDNYDSFTYNIVQTVAANGLKEGRTEDIRVFETIRSPCVKLKNCSRIDY